MIITLIVTMYIIFKILIFVNIYDIENLSIINKIII